MKPRDKGMERKIAGERVELLMGMAKEEAKVNPERAKRYVELARRIAMRYRVHMPRGLARGFCKKCGMPWVHGFNVKVRAKAREKCMEYECSCGAKRRFPYSRLGRVAET